MGRPFSAKLKLNDANEVVFDFGNADAHDDTVAPDFSAQTPLGHVPEVRGARVRARQPLRVREGRRTRQDLRLPLGPHDPAASGRARSRCASCWRRRRPTCCSSCRRARAGRSPRSSSCRRTARSASSSRRRTRPRRAAAARGRPRRCACWARIRRRARRSNCTAARYGPYVKHGAVNATMPDRDQVDTLTLDDALALLAAKTGKPRPPAPRGPPPSPRRAHRRRPPRRRPRRSRRPRRRRRRRRRRRKRDGEGAARPAAKTPVARKAAATKAAPKAAAKSAARKPKAS